MANGRINLNADLGEGYGPWRMGDDEALLGIVASANIACGFHAGDPLIMRNTVRLALQRGVSLGAHPLSPTCRVLAGAAWTWRRASWRRSSSTRSARCRRWPRPKAARSHTSSRTAR